MKTWKHCTVFGILAIITLVFAFIACDDGSNGGTDPALNGTWVDQDSFWESKYNNGNWEGSSNNGILQNKGTYTTNNGKRTSKTTHLWGKAVWITIDLEPRWYTKAELRSFDIDSLDTLMPEAYTTSYSINGNTLTLTHNGGYTNVLIRK